MLINLNQACTRLSQGGVVALPTETVYGLAASLKHEEAISQIFTLKGRPANNPLIIHVADVEQMEPFVSFFPPDFTKLATNLWPGPLTLVLPIHEAQVPHVVRAGLPTAAFRIPSHSYTRQVIQSVGPLVMPSANLSGRPSATQAKHVESDFGEHFPVLDGGACVSGLESTILYFIEDQWKIVRLGSISPETLSCILNYEPPIYLNAAKPLCPGQMYRHYAPKAKLYIDSAKTPNSIGTVLGFSDRNYPNCTLFSMGHSHNPQEVAENLYGVLRSLDDAHVQEIWVDNDFPQNGLWLTILERLTRACS